MSLYGNPPLSALDSDGAFLLPQVNNTRSLVSVVSKFTILEQESANALKHDIAS
jgi:hypothetical protein